MWAADLDVREPRAFRCATAERTGRKVTGFTPAAAHQPLRYAWPGNDRELENAVERATVPLYRKLKEYDRSAPG